MEDWEEDYFTEETVSAGKKAAVIISLAALSWLVIGLVIAAST